MSTSDCGRSKARAVLTPTPTPSDRAQRVSTATLASSSAWRLFDGQHRPVSGERGTLRHLRRTTLALKGLASAPLSGFLSAARSHRTGHVSMPSQRVFCCSSQSVVHAAPFDHIASIQRTSRSSSHSPPVQFGVSRVVSSPHQIVSTLISSSLGSVVVHMCLFRLSDMRRVGCARSPSNSHTSRPVPHPIQ